MLRLVVKIDLVRRLPPKSRMWPPTVVKLEIAREASACGRYGVIGLQVNFFIFHRSPERFDEDIITPRASAIHAEANALCSDTLRKEVTDTLTALIRIQDVGRAITGDGLLHCPTAKPSIVIDRHQARTRRVYQSTTTTRYTNPLARRI